MYPSLPRLPALSLVHIAGKTVKRSWSETMKYAILDSGGKQYVAREGETIEVDRLPLEIGKPVEFNDVLLIADNGDVAIGTPTLKGATVKGRVLDHIKAAKIIVFKYVPKQRYRRKQGHRQRYTRVAIEGINVGVAPAKKSATKETPAAAPKTTASKKKAAAPKAKSTAKPAAKKATTKKPATKKAEKKAAPSKKSSAAKSSTTQKASTKSAKAGSKKATGKSSAKPSSKKSSSTKKK
jgi:large subunit ribosomal protein L21